MMTTEMSTAMMTTENLECVLQLLLAAHCTPGLSKTFVDKHYLLCKSVDDPRLALGIHIVKTNTIDVRVLTPTLRAMHNELLISPCNAMQFVNALETIMCHMETEGFNGLVQHFCTCLKPFTTSSVIHMTRSTVLGRYIGVTKKKVIYDEEATPSLSETVYHQLST